MRFRSLAVLLAFVVALVLLSGCSSEEPQFFSKSYSYTLEVKVHRYIENVTFLVPIPMRGERPAVGPTSISDAFYTDRLPEQFTSAIVPVDGQYYLRLSAPFMDPAEPVYVKYLNSTSLGQKFRLEIVPQLIDTRHPFGNESLFYPKQNLTLTGGSPVTVSTSYYIAGYYGGYSYSYAIPVYAYYENETRVTIFSSIRGMNGWVEGFDGHRNNGYFDQYHLTINGKPQGWMAARGDMMTGEGFYREWQLAPNGTAGAG